MGRFAALLALFLSLTIGAWAAGVRYGMSRAEVEEALGTPTAELKQGARFVLLYPKAGRVEFEGDVVVSVKNLSPGITSTYFNQLSSGITSIYLPSIAEGFSPTISPRLPLFIYLA